MPLLGCPFCREFYPSDEASVCPVCGVALAPIERLPPSYEARLALEEEIAAIPPEDRVLPWWSPSHGRGTLVAIAVLGLAAFFSPWIELSRPDEIRLTGFELARARGIWFFGGAVGWFTLIPLVLSRRSVRALWGIRAVAALFAALSVVLGVQLLTHPPVGSRYVPVRFAWEWGLFATVGLGALGTAAALRLGGSARRDAGGPAPSDHDGHAGARDRTLH